MGEVQPMLFTFQIIPTDTWCKVQKIKSILSTIKLIKLILETENNYHKVLASTFYIEILLKLKIPLNMTNGKW